MVDKEPKSKTIRVSIEFYKLIERQRQIIKEATYNKIDASDCEVTDILAQKFGKKLYVT